MPTMITGYEIMDRLEILRLRAKMLSGEFEKAIFVFAGEVRRTPEEIVADYMSTERKMGELQAIQDRFNSTTKVKFGAGKITLTEAIKLSGTFGAVKTLWLKATDNKKKDRYSYRDTDAEPTRDKEKIYAERAITVPDALKKVEAYQVFAIEARMAIRTGNGTEVAVDDDVYQFIFLDTKEG